MPFWTWRPLLFTPAYGPALGVGGGTGGCRLAGVPCSLRVASAGQHRLAFVRFSLGPVPLSVLSNTLCSRSFLCFTSCHSQVSEPGPLVLMLAQDRTHAAVLTGVCVCLFKFVFNYFLHVVPFLLPPPLWNFSRIWQRG